MSSEGSSPVSIGICAHNEEDTIGKLVEQVVKEDIEELEKIVIVTAGEDDTCKIVAEKAEDNSEIVHIHNEERRGQVRAQNQILEEIDSDYLVFLDGDGLIEEGSIRKIIDSTDQETISYGREVPAKQEGWLGEINGLLWDMHHKINQQFPKFSTQIGCIPLKIIDKFPEDIVLDDVYIEGKALEKGYELKYVPEAIKYHHTADSLRFYFHQREKNWSGRLQVYKRGMSTLQTTGMRLRFFFRSLMDSDKMREKFLIMIMGLIELTAYSSAYYKAVRNKWPVIWYR